MAKIKTKDAIKGTIKQLDKASIASIRMKRVFIQTKEKAETTTNTKEESAEEYASIRVEDGLQTIAHEISQQAVKDLRFLKSERSNQKKAIKTPDVVDEKYATAHIDGGVQTFTHEAAHHQAVKTREKGIHNAKEDVIETKHSKQKKAIKTQDMVDKKYAAAHETTPQVEDTPKAKQAVQSRRYTQQKLIKTQEMVKRIKSKGQFEPLDEPQIEPIQNKGQAHLPVVEQRQKQIVQMVKENHQGIEIPVKRTKKAPTPQAAIKKADRIAQPVRIQQTTVKTAQKSVKTAEYTAKTIIKGKATEKIKQAAKAPVIAAQTAKRKMVQKAKKSMEAVVERAKSTEKTQQQH